MTYEIGPGKTEGDRTLVISCDGIKAGIPSVQKVTLNAPKLDGWTVVAFRQPVNEAVTLEMDDIRLSSKDILFDYNAAPDDMVDLSLFIDKDLNDENKSDYMRASLVLLDAAVGEYFVMTKVRYLSVDRSPKATGSLYRLTEIGSVLNDKD